MIVATFLVTAIALCLIDPTNGYTNIGNVLNPGEYLYENQVMLSPDGKIQLLVQSDGNVVLYDLEDTNSDGDAKVLWATNTGGAAADKQVKLLYHKLNGKLMVFFDDEQKWSADVCHYESWKLILQNDGNLVAHSSDASPYWDSKDSDRFPSECQGQLDDHDVSLEFTMEDYNDAIDGFKICKPSYLQELADPAFPDECPDGYPDYDGASLCYEACPDGWYSDGLTLCYKHCPDGWDDVAGVCWNKVVIEPQESVSRGIGRIPNQCGSGKSLEGGLCYKKCRSGYSGSLCTCWKGWSSYGRGCGVVPTECPSSHPDKQGGLCYKSCPSDYPVGELTVCYESCENQGAVDTGLFCQWGEIKSYVTERYTRKAVLVECRNGVKSGAFCYKPCGNGYESVLGMCWNQHLDNSIAAVLATAPQLSVISACYSTSLTLAIDLILATFLENNGITTDFDFFLDDDFSIFLDCAFLAMETMGAIDKSWDPDGGVTVAVTASATAQFGPAGLNVYGGIAFEFENEHNVNIWGFVGGCDKVDLTSFSSAKAAIGIDAGMGIFRNISAIDGAASYVSMGINLFSVVDIGSSWAIDGNCRVSGMSTTAGVSVDTSDPTKGAAPVTPSAATGNCVNFHRALIGYMESPKMKKTAAKEVASHSHSDLEFESESHSKPVIPQQPEPPIYPQMVAPNEGGDYVFVISSKWIWTAAALSVLLLTVTVMMLWICNGEKQRVRVYEKVVMDTESEAEMAKLQGI